MIYRVRIEKDNISLGDMLDKAAQVGNLCYSNGDMFIESEKPHMEMAIMFNGCAVDEIRQYFDIEACSELVKNWCNSVWESDALKHFENSEEGQTRMRYVMTALDQLEEKRRGEDAKDANKVKRRKADSGAS